MRLMRPCPTAWHQASDSDDGHETHEAMPVHAAWRQLDSSSSDEEKQDVAASQPSNDDDVAQHHGSEGRRRGRPPSLEVALRSILEESGVFAVKRRRSRAEHLQQLSDARSARAAKAAAAIDSTESSMVVPHQFYDLLADAAGEVALQSHTLAARVFSAAFLLPVSPCNVTLRICDNLVSWGARRIRSQEVGRENIGCARSTYSVVQARLACAVNVAEHRRVDEILFGIRHASQSRSAVELIMVCSSVYRTERSRNAGHQKHNEYAPA